MWELRAGHGSGPALQPKDGVYPGVKCPGHGWCGWTHVVT